MANDEHLAMLKNGVDTWNAWRGANANIRPDLSGRNLARANLRGADFFRANLARANLSRTDLSWRVR